MMNEVVFSFISNPLLPMQILITSMVHECINLEITIDGKLCNLICLYRSPSQSMEEFEAFIKNLELNL